MKKVIILTVFAACVFIVGASSASAQTSIAGEWSVAMNTPGGVRNFGVVFVVDGEKLTGTVKRDTGDLPLVGTLKGNDVSFGYTIDYNGHALGIAMYGKVDGDKMGGDVSFGGQGDDTWTATRVKKADSKADPK